MNKIRTDYRHTIYASYLGYITQAIVNNFVPLLFLTLRGSYGISLDKITFLVTLNFGVQLVVDMFAAKFADRLGYRACMIAAHAAAAAGLVGLAVFPELFPSPYAGIVFAVALYAIGGGLTEVLVSPIVEACPTEKKETAMSLLHSFYCWGHVGVVLLSTLFFAAVGISHWRLLACLWALLPFANCFYFAAVPIRVLVEEKERLPIKKLVTDKAFWVFFLLMVCAGASEQGMSQWASAFAEAGLGVSKTVGDLAGPCTFALLMGTSRMFYGKWGEKLPLKKFMYFSTVLCFFSYLLAALSGNSVFSLAGCALCGLSVGIMWPGTFSMAAKQLRRGGTAVFALLALAGDFGCSAGPAVVGFAAEAFGSDIKKGILCGILFPVLLFVGLCLCRSGDALERAGS